MKKFFIGSLIVVLIGGGGVVGYYFLGNNEPLTIEDNTITVATFNVQNLGRDKAYQVPNVARIVEQFDIVAIQEVMNYDNGTKGKLAIEAIVDSLGNNWNFIISDEANGTESAANSNSLYTFEFYAFIWNTNKIELINNSALLWNEEANPIAELTEQERQFDREPYFASFKSVQGNLDFTLISFHAAAPGKSWRDDEIKRLKIVYEYVQDLDANQNDIFLCGDFNTPVNKGDWDTLKSVSSMTHILSKDDKTTVDKSTGKLSNNQYDTFWYQSAYTGEDIVAGSGQVLSAWNITMDIDPDLVLPDDITDEENQKRWFYAQMISDHLPVIIVLRNDADSDNFTPIF